MIHMTLQVLAIAVSACKKFVAIADAAGILSLYKISEVLLFGHSVVRTNGSDSVLCIKFATSEEEIGSNDAQDLVVIASLGILLRLGNLHRQSLSTNCLKMTKTFRVKS
ncbi:unnamed protein product [Peronospora farinosa]|uniref:Uncharacterized protein n=1 Tax=Peronospora farinosa TaxID=134698 RepID=A0AAV0TIM6_9STRA|nr:unnamed protein product [Peronospora farinosa]CAI5722177.1 unnamed protein product [Peronospora farinosa]